MLKAILKFLAAISAIAGVFAALSWFTRSKTSDYVEIYSPEDDDDTF